MNSDLLKVFIVILLVVQILSTWFVSCGNIYSKYSNLYFKNYKDEEKDSSSSDSSIDEEKDEEGLKENFTENFDIDDDEALLKSSGSGSAAEDIPAAPEYNNVIKNKFLGANIHSNQKEFVKTQGRGMPNTITSANLMPVRTDRVDINPWRYQSPQYTLNGKSFVKEGARVLPSEFPEKQLLSSHRICWGSKCSE